VTGGWTADSVEAVFREERGRLLAILVRQFGDLDLAEDAASEAIEAALERWPVDGVPATPVAWLLTTARRKAVDRLRRDRACAARPAIMQVEAQHGAAASGDLLITRITPNWSSARSPRISSAGCSRSAGLAALARWVLGSWC
jgi:predicted RNA polymerase sigma factor